MSVVLKYFSELGFLCLLCFTWCLLFLCCPEKESFSLCKCLILFLFGGKSETINLIFNGFFFGNNFATWRDVLWLALKIKALLLFYLEHFNIACDLSLFIKRKRGKKIFKSSALVL